MRSTVDATRSLHKYVAQVLAQAEPTADWEVRLWDEEGTFKTPFARVAKVGPVVPTGPAVYTEFTQPMAVHLYPTPQPTSEQAEMRSQAVTDMLYVGFREGVKWTEPLSPPRITQIGAAVATGGVLAVGDYFYAVSSVDALGHESLPSLPVTVHVAGAGSVVTLYWTPVPEAASFRIYRGATVNNLRFVGVAVPAAFDDNGVAAPGVVPLAAPTATVTVKGLPERIPLYDFDTVPLDGPLSDSTLRHPSDYLKIVQGSLSVNSLTDPVDDRLRTIIADMRVTWRRSRTITGKPVKSLITAFDSVG